MPIKQRSDDERYMVAVGEMDDKPIYLTPWYGDQAATGLCPTKFRSKEAALYAYAVAVHYAPGRFAFVNAKIISDNA